MADKWLEFSGFSEATTRGVLKVFTKLIGKHLC